MMGSEFMNLKIMRFYGDKVWTKPVFSYSKRIKIGIVKKVSEFFFSELCALCLNIVRALRNRLHQTVFRNSTGNAISRAGFNFCPNKTINKTILDQNRNKLQKWCAQWIFENKFGVINSWEHEIYFYRMCKIRKNTKYFFNDP